MNPERENVERRIAEVKRSLATRIDQLGGRVNRARRVLAVRGHVRDHLGASLGVAAAVGFLLGRRAVRHQPLLPGEIDLGPRKSLVGSLVGSIVGSVVRSVITSVLATAATTAVQMMAADDPEHPAGGFASHPDDPPGSGPRPFV